ncbi:hypothetical protein K461DRAFT_73443 [Myriangium duriaei CBS 260.36]|uniref:RING-type domain-containing protein n=1 Tax=Myriangium duriaei CBS 260.36 TaxID=1168546 RepID=A0A9P4MCH5_9PEZI|nr:hypothetical protein K461DRAFT_73443 [Myriangium duriaei CBS 260.36]
MLSSRWMWLLSAVVAAVSADASPYFKIAPMPNGYQFNDTSSQTVLSYASSNGRSGVLTVAPLMNQTAEWPTYPVSLLYSPNGTTIFSVNSTTIIYFPCDPDAYPAIGADSVENLYLQVSVMNAGAILLYSSEGPGCNLTQIAGVPMQQTYKRVWTLTSPLDADHLLADDNSTTDPLIATLGPQTVLNYTDFTNITQQYNNPSKSYSPSLNTQVAMIVLYTVTGLVSALFLVIIAMGAIRAHRHPERYGPRAARRGRSHQTRAGGLARAMLDSLPIVKFGAPETPKQPDVELANANEHSETVRSDSAPTLTKENTPDQTPKQSPDSSPELDRSSVRSGIGPATVAAQPADPQNNEEAPSCSICTDDFEPGQDMRVLPCDHKFHPACVDPWLVNVSGTCPLCRIDLHPPRSSQDSGDSLDWGDHIYDHEGNETGPGPDEPRARRNRFGIPDTTGYQTPLRRQFYAAIREGEARRRERERVRAQRRQERQERRAGQNPTAPEPAQTTPAEGSSEQQEQQPSTSAAQSGQ